MAEVIGPLPAYNESSANDYIPPPAYTAPSHFVIGKSVTEAPLVNVHEILGHLTLLHAFAELKNAVEAIVTPQILGVTLNQEERWSWFVGCAVERFDIWCHSLQSTDSTIDAGIMMPPLDVMMVWHAYMLNPRWFAEDSTRRDACKNLKLLEPRFTECINVFPSLLHQPPSLSRVDFWRRTSLPFDYSLDGINAIKKKTVGCHFCGKEVSVDLINPEGTGYLQGFFSFDCPHSHSFSRITKETLAVRKFANDLAGSDSLSGAAFTTSATEAKAKVASIRTDVASKVKVFGSFQKYKEGTPEYVDALSTAIGQATNFSMVSLRKLLGNASRLTSKIMTAYFNDKVYSIELVGAVIRQGGFVRKMYELGWTRTGYFEADIDALALQHALARYHAFLDLLSSSTSSFFVPTLDIDLVWHTHQLMPTKYQQDCGRYVGRFIDHDDNVETPRLTSEFDTTCDAWKSRFEVKYTHCGCPVPGDSIGNRVLRLVGDWDVHPPSHLVPYNRPDLSETSLSDPKVAITIPQANNRTVEEDGTLVSEKERKPETATRQTFVLHVQEKGAGLNDPPAYDYDGDCHCPGSVAPYFYGAFLIPVPMYFGGEVVVCKSKDSHAECGGCGGCNSSACSNTCSGGGSKPNECGP